MPKVTLKYCTIAEVLEIDPKANDSQRKNKMVVLYIDEEDLFEMFDNLNPKNIIKYLDMRGIQHREPAKIAVKVTPNASGLKLRHALKRVASELDNARKLNAK